jgi:hypothetical protein
VGSKAFATPAPPAPQQVPADRFGSESDRYPQPVECFT